ncbi:polysaccharide deacetylase family protein [Conexibacter woesei]|uniref:Polysaccharide deacetylase n=1 Tax=Conexibacter woesei (strain DSM 14684 / CCUG 47730 / CIP 108061 / JCM 11494 / NBRC 100937 / ID131577) TaxID=469383 RepID=D3EZG8_CONWI|nr:polysaccharide deacetylase family protein [Conexibacter woesei]ADB53806.1 polysaccharide deacetylase [Conexibacter woesei DSM 14684]
MLSRILQLAVLAVVTLAFSPLVASAQAPGGGRGGGGGAAPGGGEAPTQPETTAPTPLRLDAASLKQAGDGLELSFSTTERWSPASLRNGRRSLCLRLVFETTSVNSRDVCVRRRGATTTLTLARVLRSGGHGPLHALDARVRKPSPRSLTARLSLAKIGIAAGSSVRWRVISSTDGCDLAGGGNCFQARPQDGAVLSLATPQPIGCIPAGPAYVTNGSRARKQVALTFDDGPSALTPNFLDVLRSKGVKGTFFMIGQQVAPNASLVRRMLAEGHELADHTWSHPNVSAGGSFASGQITSTAGAIQAASGFRPCSFRAPGGAVSPALTGLARGLGFTTVQWDVDPLDWKTPGSDAIYSRIVGRTRNGSIVLMHDGGGPRSQTLAALPRIIDTLRARGYRFVTVADMLGATFTYR